MPNNFQLCKLNVTQLIRFLKVESAHPSLSLKLDTGICIYGYFFFAVMDDIPINKRTSVET